MRMYIHKHICIYVYVCIHTCVSMHNCMYVYIYLYSIVILVHMGYSCKTGIFLLWCLIAEMYYSPVLNTLPMFAENTSLGFHRSKQLTQSEWIESIFLQLLCFIFPDTNNLLHSFVYSSHRWQNITWDLKYHILEILEFGLWGNAADCL